MALLCWIVCFCMWCFTCGDERVLKDLGTAHTVNEKVILPMNSIPSSSAVRSRPDSMREEGTGREREGERQRRIQQLQRDVHLSQALFTRDKHNQGTLCDLEITPTLCLSCSTSTRDKQSLYFIWIYWQYPPEMLLRLHVLKKQWLEKKKNRHWSCKETRVTLNIYLLWRFCFSNRFELALCADRSPC